MVAVGEGAVHLGVPAPLRSHLQAESVFRFETLLRAMFAVHTVLYVPYSLAVIACERDTPVGALLRSDEYGTYKTVPTANMAYIRQSRPDVGLGLKAKVLHCFSVVPISLASGLHEGFQVDNML